MSEHLLLAVYWYAFWQELDESIAGKAREKKVKFDDAPAWLKEK